MTRPSFAFQRDSHSRTNFVVSNVAELCRKYGISRETGYVWLRRFQDTGHKLDGIVERSRAPLTIPTKVSERVENAIVDARKQFPCWFSTIWSADDSDAGIRDPALVRWQPLGAAQLADWRRRVAS